jgi:hypothetical protein
MTLRRAERPRPASLNTFGNIHIPGTRAGAIVSVGLIAVAWFAIPLARVFILGTVAMGVVVGSILWWIHNR